MTLVSETCMGRMTPLRGERSDPADRLSRFLRKQYDRAATRRLSEELGCTEKAAENYLNGHWPPARIWVGIIRRFGRDVVEAVFGPDIDATVSRLDREVAALEQQLHERRARLAQVRGAAESPESLAAAPATVEARSFGGER